MADDCLILYAPRDKWLVLLAEGWTFASDLAAPMPGPHGFWSVMLERPADDKD